MEPWLDKERKPLVKIKQLSKSFSGELALQKINLSIYTGEFFALLGPSGCGKSTLLRILAGLEQSTTGDILLGSECINDVPVYKRPINMMFQSYALFPHMTVKKNIAFGLKFESLSKVEVTQRTEEAIEMVQLQEYVKRKPYQLSGGQQQRVALARSLVKRPQLLLLDEPLGSLDKKLREQTQLELVDLQEKLGITFIMVTHDQEEAMTMASRIALLKDGKISQVDTPRNMYEYPKSRFVANFIGDINILEAQITGILEEKIDTKSANNHSLSVKNSKDLYQQLTVGARVGYAIRPEKIYVWQKDDKPFYGKFDNQIFGKVSDIGYLGNRTIYHIETSSAEMIRVSMGNIAREDEMPISWGDEVCMCWQNNVALLLLK